MTDLDFHLGGGPGGSTLTQLCLEYPLVMWLIWALGNSGGTESSTPLYLSLLHYLASLYL